MKKIKILKFIPFISFIPFINSCATPININEELIQATNELKLNFKNYFNSKTLGKKDVTKNILSTIVNKYRLYEWNEYWSKSEQRLSKSKVLNLAWIDYSINKNKTMINKIFNDNKIKWTSIYNEQDKQFRYFNDLINFLNEEDNQNHEDFLYLRWLYYSYDAAKKYKNIKVNNKKIYEINISDWTKAAQELLPPTLNPKPLLAIINGFLEYYGASIKLDDLNDITSLLDPSKITKLDNSIIHSYLIAKDMSMRFSSIPDDELNTYSLIKAKAKRTKEILQLEEEKYNLLAQSFINSKDNNQNEEIAKILKPIQDILMKVVDLLANLSNIKFEDYVNINQINKYKEI